MKTILAKVWAFLKSIKITWVVVTVAFAFLLHIGFLGLPGAIALTVLFIIFHGKIETLSIPVSK